MVMLSIRYGDKSYKYVVHSLESRKKSISIHVLPDASIEVKAPLHTPPQKIDEVMKKRARWIARHVDQIQQRRSQVLPREYISGETHFYLGRRYVLKVTRSDTDQVKLLQGSFMVECKDTAAMHVKALLDDWYKVHAKQVFERRLNLVAANIAWLDGLPPVTIRHMKKQWGSCSSHRRISLNWNLVKAPMECIDYVITHELCHLREHNHSKNFYTLVGRYAPEWKQIKTKLDGISELLLNE